MLGYLNITLYLFTRKYSVYFLSLDRAKLEGFNANGSIVFPSVSRPDPQVGVGLDCFIGAEVILDQANELGPFASVQKQKKGLFGNRYCRIDCHKREKVGAQGVCQLPVGPAWRGTKVYNTGRQDYPNRQNDVCQNVNIGSLYVDILKMMLFWNVHVLLRCDAIIVGVSLAVGFNNRGGLVLAGER